MAYLNKRVDFGLYNVSPTIVGNATINGNLNVSQLEGNAGLAQTFSAILYYPITGINNYSLLGQNIACSPASTLFAFRKRKRNVFTAFMQ